jgi:methyl-accepting chemotaxis protein
MRYRQIQAALILAPTDEARTKEAATLNSLQDTISTGMKEYEPLITPGEERRLADAIVQGWAEYGALTPKLVQSASGGDQKAATAFYTGEMRTVFNTKVMDTLHADIDLNNKGGIKAADEGAVLYRTVHNLIIGALVLAALLARGGEPRHRSVRAVLRWPRPGSRDH